MLRLLRVRLTVDRGRQSKVLKERGVAEPHQGRDRVAVKGEDDHPVSQERTAVLIAVVSSYRRLAVGTGRDQPETIETALSRAGGEKGAYSLPAHIPIGLRRHGKERVLSQDRHDCRHVG